MIQSESLELLLSAARSATQAHGDQALDRAIANIKDWDAAIEFASQHAVIPLLARSLRDREQVPLPVRRKLYRYYFEGCSRGPTLLAELQSVLAAIQEAGAEVLAYKGLALAALAYGDITLRHPPGDLDLLLHKTDIFRARAVLLARGYQPQSPESETHFLKHRYHLHFQRQNPDVQVELHWALTPRYWPFPIHPDHLWKRAAQVSVSGAPVGTLNAECMLLALCAHGAKEAWPRLSQIVDLARLIQSHPQLDWDRVLMEARRMRRERVLRLGLWLVTELLGVPVPEAAAAELRKDKEVPRLGLQIAHGLVTGRVYGTDFHRYALRVWHHTADRARYLIYLCLLLPEKILTLVKVSGTDRDFLDLHGPASLLYVFVRPLRVLRQYRDPRLMMRKLMKNL